MFLMEIQTYLLFIYSVEMFVLIPGSIRSVRFWPAETVSAGISIRAATYIHIYIILQENRIFAVAKWTTHNKHPPHKRDYITE